MKKIIEYYLPFLSILCLYKINYILGEYKGRLQKKNSKKSDIVTKGR